MVRQAQLVNDPSAMRYLITGAAISSAGDYGTSHDSGSSAQSGDAARGAAIEHVVAAQEAAQEMQGLDSDQVRG